MKPFKKQKNNLAILKFNGVGITAMAGAVPKNIVKNLEYTTFFNEQDVQEIVEKTGIFERRFAPEGMCASDLCFAAAEQLISDNKIDKSEIDLLIFISQTADFRMPATAILLQDRLGLSKSTMAFDISLGCSAFVYGLSVVYSLMERSGFRKALILDGETRSRIYHPKDRKTAFLFGDAGVAALVERDEKFGDSFFSLGSDGSKSQLISMKAGGYRYPSSVETLTEKVIDEFGNISTDEHGRMDGGEVFNFVLKEIPSHVKELLLESKMSQDSIDFFVFHQANLFMNGYLQKKFKIEDSKFPLSINKFGNTSSVSIPLTIVSELKNKLSGHNQLLLCGFGVGMSWASCVINTNEIRISQLLEI